MFQAIRNSKCEIEMHLTNWFVAYYALNSVRFARCGLFFLVTYTTHMNI